VAGLNGGSTKKLFFFGWIPDKEKEKEKQTPTIRFNSIGIKKVAARCFGNGIRLNGNCCMMPN
jgi:hypothetical protein